ncbi:GerAB/ArcD/ProY family transporter [Paenibacillus agilis]|uniref:GerAB/ArcD/ProY family transporter n=1 Tax=Paenibacillus agilis TaxID=3020863 RepID=A0A559IWL4_9BACL|nr:GerAB/ArcD/ProY family transporter [Paenibacillus agilis]TVX92025.1 GerAB/ArcD/ProY family transporter [Paenibacillus agilis]
MDVRIKPRPNKRIQSFALLFIICNVQIGIGVFGFQRYVAREAGHDAWISVLLAGLVCHFSGWMILRVLRRYESADLYGIHQDLFGRWIGGALSIVLILYYVIVTVTILRTYIEAVQSWIFPEFPTWLLAVVLLFLSWYAGISGLRVIAGVSFMGFLVIFAFSMLYYNPIQYGQWNRLLPIAEASPYQLFNGAVAMGFTLSGFEIVFFLYPYLKDKEKSQKYMQLSMLLTNALYLFIMIVTTIFFSQDQLLRSVWSSINMLKIVKYPFLERIEVLAMGVWMFAVVPGIIILTWVISRGMRRLFNFEHKKVLIIFSIGVFVVSLVFHNRQQIDMLNNLISKMSLIISFVYPIILNIAVAVVWSWRQRQANKGEGGSQHEQTSN